MNTYTTLEGRTIEYPDPPPAVAVFLTRVKAAAEDPSVSADEMVLLVYGPGNPLLDHAMFPGRSMIVPATLANPVYRIMSDLMGVKDLRLGRLDPEKMYAAYTVGVAEAAEQLGLTQQAVRAAIESWRLSAVFRDGQWWLRPESIASYKVSARGPKPRHPRPSAPGPVQVRVGGAKGASLSVRVVGGDLVTEGKDDGATVGRFPPGWSRAVVRTRTARGTRAFEIEPAPGEAGAIEHAGLFVRGPFRVVKKHNATTAATAAWRAAGTRAAV